MSDRKRQHTFRGLIATAAALIASAVIATVLTIIGLYGDATQDAERDAGNIAIVLAEQASHSVQAIDGLLTGLQHRFAVSTVATPAEFRAAFGTAQMLAVLREQIGHLTEADVVSLVDADGHIVVSSHGFPARPIDLGDRDYFRHAQETAAAPLFVSTPLTNRYSGTRAIVFSRRLENVNGTFLGVAIASVQTSFFRHVYQSASALSGRSFLLLRRDGTVLVRHPQVARGSTDHIHTNSP